MNGAERRQPGTPESKRSAVVLGAGVCGLRAALTFARAGWSVCVIEREAWVGGLAASPRSGGNPQDFGVHMLHGFDEELRDDLVQLMGEEAVEVPLNAEIRWRGRAFRYPLKFSDLLVSLSFMEMLGGVCGLAWTGLRNRVRPPPEPSNAEEALIQLYGTHLYRLFFESFTHRYWARHPRELSATFIKSKMPRLSAIDAVRRFLRRCGLPIPAPKVESALDDEILVYSRRGSSALPEAIAREIIRLGGQISTAATVQTIHFAGQEVRQVSLTEGDGAVSTWSVDALVSTIPPAAFVEYCQPAPPASVSAAVQALQYRPMVVYAVLLDRGPVTGCLYTYFRERRFHRVSEPRNAGLRVSPDGATLLLFEVMCERGDAFWEGHESAWTQIIEEARTEKLLPPEATLLHRDILRNAEAYPVFRQGFEPNWEAFRAWVKRCPNLRSVGRQGGFSYPNMHTAMRQGEEAANSLIEGE
ncbi:MAG: FAD-dependent oxidoreductase [Opitutales bacterium]|nr:FAD-dependent oxidoreductase [Opitutales bacterium]